MRISALGLTTFAMLSACGNAESTTSTTGGLADEGAPLSISADLMLTNLAVVSPEPLPGVELCDNVGLCGDDQAVAARELLILGLVMRPTESSYQLTEAGQRYLRDNYRIVRDGDRTIIETRGNTD